jgi:hypothetical protein
MLILHVKYKGEDISNSRRARELVLVSNWGRIQFTIQLCTLEVWWPHQGRTLTDESALVKKITFSVRELPIQKMQLNYGILPKGV